jgi:hypothetical protein
MRKRRTEPNKKATPPNKLRDRSSLLFDDPIEEHVAKATLFTSESDDSNLDKNSELENAGIRSLSDLRRGGWGGDEEYPTVSSGPRIRSFSDIPPEWFEKISVSQYDDAVSSSKPRDRNRSARFFLDAQKQSQAENLKIQLNNQVNVSVAPTIIVEHDSGFFPAPLSETARNSETLKLGAPETPKLGAPETPKP